jgi:Tol biopolymer transport system component/alpha-tubulin suppressor-like RCC1 family protein
VLSALFLSVLTTVPQACQRDEATAPRLARPSAQATGAPAATDASAARIVFTSQRDGTYQIYLMNADGSGQTRLTHDTFSDHHPAWSPDGRRIAFTGSRDGNEDIYVMSGDGSPPVRLTNNPATDTDPDWSPDGRQIVFTSTRDRQWQVYVMNADGSAQTRLTNDLCSADTHPRWSPDGRTIVFTGDCGPRDLSDQIFVMNPDGSGRTRLTNEPTSNRDPSWSPDGRQIVFSKHGQIYVMNADGSAQTPLTNPAAGSDASLSPDARQIVFWRNVSPSNAEVFVMNADGSGQTRLTNSPGFDFFPHWARRDPPPQLALPGDLTAPATRLNGAVVEYTASATDPTDPGLNVSCTPASGTRFPIGTTQVQCTTSDAAWNTVSGAFQVIVQGADEQLAGVARDLGELVAANPGTPLAAKAEDARARVEAARQQLAATPGYRMGPLGELNGAVGSLAAAVEGGLLDAARGNALMDRITNAARLLAEAAIAAAVDRGADPKDVAKAERALAKGDEARAAGHYPDAVAQYQNASKHAEDHGRAAIQLAFTTQPPATVEGAAAISPAVRVAIQDAFGNTVAGTTYAVTVAFAANPTGATLAGTTTVNAVNGIATFADLSLDRPGSGYTLAATASGVTGATSTAFAVHLTFTAVSAGIEHTCGLTASHAVYCWGGDGVSGGAATGDPTPMLVGLGFTAISGGRFHTCGLTSGGAAYCWGENSSGQLGDGTTTFRASPTPVIGGLSFATLTLGGVHTCGLTSGGAAYCWGDNSSGQLGDGTTMRRTSPTLVAGVVGVTALGAGYDHTCGVTTSGASYCWGWNSYGQLGDGTQTSHATPGPVAGELSFTTISVGRSHTCGVASDGATYCWGRMFREFGPGEVDRIIGLSPTPLPGGLSFTAVDSRHTFHGCGVTTTSAAYCWGVNSSGELGDGTTARWQDSPVPVTGGLAFAAVSVGERHTCGVTTGGAAYCWGSNLRGQLGDGTRTVRTTPVPVVQ